MFINKKINLGQQMLLIILLVMTCVLLSSCSKKPQNEKVYKIGILAGASFFAPAPNGFKEGMAELGYVEGENIIYDIQEADIEYDFLDKYTEILNEFVEEKVDLVYCFPTEASLKSKEITEGTGIPVVFSIANIEGNNLVDSVQKPGGHITGVRYPGPDLAIKRLEFFQELLPEAERILLPYMLSYPTVAPELEVLRPAAESMGIELIELPGENAEELQSGLDALRKENIDAVLQIDDPLTTVPDTFKIVAKFAADRNIPIGGMYVSAGGYESTFGVSIDSFATGKQAAVLADKVLRGTPAGTIPVVSSESYLLINYRQAQKLGINISQGLLIRANEIIR